jgi:hypothetical protein
MTATGREHELKCWPAQFAAILGGEKTSELRLNDRGFGVGDALVLREWVPLTGTYTGRTARVLVSHVLEGFAGLAGGYVVLSIQQPASPPIPAPERQALYDLREALQDRNIDGVDVWNHWLDDDGSLHRRIDALLASPPGERPDQGLIQAALHELDVWLAREGTRRSKFREAIELSRDALASRPTRSELPAVQPTRLDLGL